MPALGRHKKIKSTRKRHRDIAWEWIAEDTRCLDDCNASDDVRASFDLSHGWIEAGMPAITWAWLDKKRVYSLYASEILLSFCNRYDIIPEVD